MNSHTQTVADSATAVATMIVLFFKQRQFIEGLLAKAVR